MIEEKLTPKNIVQFALGTIGLVLAVFFFPAFLKVLYEFWVASVEMAKGLF